MNGGGAERGETLQEKQSRFAHMLALLILYSKQRGFEVTLGDTYRDPRVPYGHPESLHKLRLAADLNLFKDGAYLQNSAAHKPLGEFWESIGGTWGGRFSTPDGNHYSLAHAGRK